MQFQQPFGMEVLELHTGFIFFTIEYTFMYVSTTETEMLHDTELAKQFKSFL